MLERSSNLSDQSGIPLHEVLKLPISFETVYFESDAWNQRKQQLKAEQDAEDEFRLGIYKLGNNIIKGLNNLSPRRR